MNKSSSDFKNNSSLVISVVIIKNDDISTGPDPGGPLDLLLLQDMEKDDPVVQHGLR